MAQRRFKIELPDDLLHVWGWPERDVPVRIKEMMVMELLRQDRVSEAEAARFLGLSRGELLDLMGKFKVPAIRLSAAELKREAAGLDAKRL